MSDEFKVQWSVSLPPSAQYAKGDMLNIRGESVEEVQALFEAILDEGSQFLSNATSVAALLRAAAVVAEGGTPTAPSTPTPTAPQSEAPVANLRVCEHGKRVRRTGTNAKGEWVGWFCPTPKGTPGQCKPDWE